MHGHTTLRFVDDRITQVKRHRVRAELLESRHRILGDEDRISRIQIRSDKIGSRRLDQLPGFPSEEVFVIFEADLEAGIHRLATHLA